MVGREEDRSPRRSPNTVNLDIKPIKRKKVKGSKFLLIRAGSKAEEKEGKSIQFNQASTEEKG